MDICTHRERQGARRPTLDAPRDTLDREKNANTAAPAGSRYYITAVQRTASIQITIKRIVPMRFILHFCGVCTGK